MNRKVVCKVCLFILIGLALFSVIQELFTPNWGWKASGGSDSKHVVDGILSLEENTVDVLFVGSSPIHDGISPMQLYENAGVCSYNLSVSGQTVVASYYFIKEAFETQTPSEGHLHLEVPLKFCSIGLNCKSMLNK